MKKGLLIAVVLLFLSAMLCGCSLIGDWLEPYQGNRIINYEEGEY